MLWTYPQHNANYGDPEVPTSRKPTTQQLKTVVVGFLDVGTCGPPYGRNDLVSGYLLLPHRGAEYCDERVSVCWSVHDQIFGTARPIFTKFLVHVTYAMVWFSSGGVVIRYVLPVLWITSYLLISQGCSKSPPS